MTDVNGFWGILGGLSLLCIVSVLLVYFICFSRNPKFCLSKDEDDLLETTVHHEEIHTVTSETRTSVSDGEEPTVVRRTEHVHRVVKKQRSWGNVLQAQKSKPVTKILVSRRLETSRSQTCSDKSGHFDNKERCHSDTASQSGKSCITSIGVSS